MSNFLLVIALFAGIIGFVAFLYAAMDKSIGGAIVALVMLAIIIVATIFYIPAAEQTYQDRQRNCASIENAVWVKSGQCVVDGFYVSV